MHDFASLLVDRRLSQPDSPASRQFRMAGAIATILGAVRTHPASETVRGGPVGDHRGCSSGRTQPGGSACFVAEAAPAEACRSERRGSNPWPSVAIQPALTSHAPPRTARVDMARGRHPSKKSARVRQSTPILTPRRPLARFPPGRAKEWPEECRNSHESEGNQCAPALSTVPSFVSTCPPDPPRRRPRPWIEDAQFTMPDEPKMRSSRPKMRSSRIGQTLRRRREPRYYWKMRKSSVHTRCAPSRLRSAIHTPLLSNVGGNLGMKPRRAAQDAQSGTSEKASTFGGAARRVRQRSR